LARLGLEPLFRSVRASCARATAIVGLTPAFVDWGLEKARRSRTELDRDFPVAYEEQPPAVDAIERAERYWDSLGVARDPNVTRACFFGIIGRSFELEAVVDAARELERRGGDFQFVLCGRGDMLEAYKTQAAGCRGIVFPGWVDAPAIWTLMRRSTVGLAPYRSTRNFVGHIPNKVVEYLSAGLPIVSSLQGSLKLFLEEHGTGVTYPNGDAGALAASLIELRSDPARLLAAARKARSLFEDRFTAGHVLGQMTRHLERVIAAHRGGIDRSVGAASPPARPSS
jgi:glycosyltransferase involved in cell wall biosynthesis